MTRSEFPALDAGQQWALDHLKICPDTLAQMGVVTGEGKFFPDLDEATDAIVFTYPGEAWKARAIAEEVYAASPDFVPALWNLDAVLASNKADPKRRIYVAQGEFNACARAEAGLSADTVLGFPNRVAGTTDDRYGFLRAAIAAGLGKALVVWCGNADAEGLAIRTEVVRIFGAARFWFVDWPTGDFNAGDVLRHEGADALRDRVENGAMPWPVEGLYRISELPEPTPLTLWNPGFPEWEGKLLLAPRTLSVVTGHPGHGKTLLWSQIWFNVARTYDVRIASASFETRPKPHVRRQLRSLFCGKLEKDLGRADVAPADEWIEDHYRFIVHPDNKPTLDWLLSIAEAAVIREGVRVIQVDPWNRLESARDPRGESETDYIGRCLRALHAFAHDMNVHVQILAHPAKMDSTRRGTAPLLEDISGSKNWDNAVDQGFVVHRDEMFAAGVRQTAATPYCRKSRFEELGYPCALELDYDLRTGAYRSTDYDPKPFPTKPRRGKAS